MQNTPDEIERWISAIHERGRGLTKWEQDFVERISEQYDEYGRISDRQEQILERIYVEKTP